MGVVSLNYSFATNNASPPGPKQVRLNNATLASVSAIYVDNTTNEGANASASLLALTTGDSVQVNSEANSARFGNFKLSAAPLNHTTWVEYPVSVVTVGQTIQAGACELVLTSGGVAPQPYLIYHYQDGDRQQAVGFAADLNTAVNLAGAWLTAAQPMYPQVGGGVGVVASATNALSGYVGWVLPGGQLPA